MERELPMSFSINDKNVDSNVQPHNANKRNQFIENGQVIYHEKRIRIENHKQVNQAIIKFREWRSAYESEKKNLSAADIPQPFTDLIALLAHESDEALDVLARRINEILAPFEYNEEVYPQFYKAIRQIIKMTSHQERYGLADVILLLKGSPASIPRRLLFYRWQAYDVTLFPEDIQQLTAKRRERRKRFSSLLTNMLQQLPVEERIELLSNDTGNLYESTLNSNTDPIKDEGKRLFSTFKQEEHITISNIQPRKRICSSFDTMIYVGLNNTFDLKQKFLSELSSEAKKPRGITKKVDMKQAWFESTTAIDSPMYKKIRSLKMKLLQFHEDVRPAYYGTWSKSQSVVNGRRPFAKDTQLLNYDYDSEAEWDYDVDGDDIHTLDPEDDEDDPLLDSSDDDEEEEVVDDLKLSTVNGIKKWVVPEGYLSDDEGIQKARKSYRTIVSRPAKWPISVNKHFPMKSIILGPSFESLEEPENHPLSDFKIHMLINLGQETTAGYSPFNRIIGADNTTISDQDNISNMSSPLMVCSSKAAKRPLFQREIDKIVNSNKEELINIILDNKSKTMMGLVSVLKSTKTFSGYTTAQLQAMIHDVAIQEMRGSYKEYNWYLRVASTLL